MSLQVDRFIKSSASKCHNNIVKALIGLCRSAGLCQRSSLLGITHCYSPTDLCVCKYDSSSSAMDLASMVSLPSSNISSECSLHVRAATLMDHKLSLLSPDVMAKLQCSTITGAAAIIWNDSSSQTSN